MFKLFSGTANPELGREVAKLLNLPLAKAEVTRFGNSEVKVTIQEEVKTQTCVVIQSTANPTDTHLMELLFFCDALRRQEAKYVIGYLPYFGYAKQNLQHRPGECVSINVVIRMLQSIGFYKIYTIDIHDEATGGVFSIPFKNLTAFPLLASHLQKYFQKQRINIKKEVVLVAPDQGAVEKVRNFGSCFYGTKNFSQVLIEKQRDLKVVHQAKPISLYGKVRGKIALIVDDMVVSGSTLIPATHLLIKHGAIKVYAAIVHHDFTREAPDKIQASPIERIFTTNTILLRQEQKFSKLEEVSVAPVIANELKIFLK